MEFRQKNNGAARRLNDAMGTQENEKTIAELAALVGGRVVGDGERVVSRVSSIE